MLQGKVLLVVDDDPLICETLADMLAMFGATVIAVTELDPMTAVLRGVDAVLLDLMLRQSRDGIELGTALRKRGYLGPLVALSASDRMLTDADAGPFSLCIVKPWDIVDLARTLQGLFPP